MAIVCFHVVFSCSLAGVVACPCVSPSCPLLAPLSFLSPPPARLHPPPPLLAGRPPRNPLLKSFPRLWRASCPCTRAAPASSSSGDAACPPSIPAPYVSVHLPAWQISHH
ncbi:hypothetical protein GDO81_029139 [Engystomops pustulosus]|uniref:Secreted protein n=1 Tax=Engystomops pustulosus TaxID=76066 RepID=A0AAV6Z262_ENGPU|nr:hypothetical protein GDO81_029139 [Engystomops pustulosus]